jgi:hypothetical protein
MRTTSISPRGSCHKKKCNTTPFNLLGTVLFAGIDMGYYREHYEGEEHCSSQV